MVELTGVASRTPRGRFVSRHSSHATLCAGVASLTTAQACHTTAATLGVRVASHTTRSHSMSHRSTATPLVWTTPQTTTVGTHANTAVIGAWPAAVRAPTICLVW